MTWLSARIGRLGTLATYATLAALATACRPGSHSNASPTRTFSDGSFRWTLTRLEGATPETQVGWLDNETVLFIGTKHSTDGSAEINGLYAWNQKSPARLVLADAYRFCFDGTTWTIRTGEPQPGRDDLIYRRYRLNPSDLSTSWIGPDHVGPSTGYLHPYTCNEEKHLPQLQGRYWEPLRPQNGFLDLGANGSRGEEVHLLNANLKRRISLGFRAEEPTSTKVHFSRFKNEYLIHRFGFSEEVLRSWTQRGGLDVILLESDGLVRRINVTPGPWSETLPGDRSIELSKPGIIISSKAGSRLRETPAGIYLIRNSQRNSKLDSGLTRNISISPDGCKVAYNRSRKEPGDNLASINLCPP
jgi:hypothetical protein